MDERKILVKLIADGKEAEVKLTELDKPKLRHGDYGINQKKQVAIIVKPHLIWPDTVNRPIAITKDGSWNYADTDYGRIQTPLGNIYDD